MEIVNHMLDSLEKNVNEDKNFAVKTTSAENIEGKNYSLNKKYKK